MSKENIFSGLLGDIVAAAEKNNPPEDEDYLGDDGLMCCGKCHTHKQRKLKALGKEMIVPTMCHCASERLENTKKQEEDERKSIRRRQIRESAFSSSNTRKCCFDADETYNTKISAFMRKYARSFDPSESSGLILYGGFGTGKSFYAACIVNAVIDRNYTAKFTSISEIEAELWGANDKKAVYDYFNSFDLLVLDDFSAERNTPYMQEIIYNVIDNRYRSKKPLIITTNLTVDELQFPKETWQKRNFSRILESSIPFAVHGKDKRQEKGMSSVRERIEKIMSFSES
ncbi:MAG: ATP-binding protein [Ruminiclostridium sp.]|nr:ATP-binding protein [Ruminiclostridium sp.]